MKVELKGSNLVITIPAKTKKLPLSKSGKTLTVAKSGGFKETDLEVEGKTLFVNVNALVYVKGKTKEDDSDE